MSYSPTSSNLTYTSWPTLGTLIDAGTRLVTFMDTHADFSTVTYIIDGTYLTHNNSETSNLLTERSYAEFTNVWETAYDVTDPTFDCDVNRTKGDSTNQMYLINHFLDTNLLGSPIPDTADLDTTNAANGTGSLGAQLDTCVGDYGRNPNFMLVDVRSPTLFFLVGLILTNLHISSTSTVADPSSRLLPLPTASPMIPQHPLLHRYPLLPRLQPRHPVAV